MIEITPERYFAEEGEEGSQGHKPESTKRRSSSRGPDIAQKHRLINGPGRQKPKPKPLKITRSL